MYCSPYIPHMVSPTVKDSKQPVIGSWIASFDANGTPFWTNSVNKETSYRLFVQQTSQPGMPLVPAGNGEIPPWSLPLKAPPPPSATTSGAESNNSRSKGAYSIRVGNWEETYDSVDGKKSWFNTKTRKTTTKDPFR